MNSFVTPIHTNTAYVGVAPPGPFYVIFMPFHVKDLNDYGRLFNRISTLAQQAFGTDPTSSHTLATQRISLVIGLNRRWTSSADSEGLSGYVNRLATCQLGLNTTFCGFTWTGLDTPFQLIRESVKTIAAHAGLDQHWQNLAQTNPFYIVSMDDDFISLNQGGEGLFTQLDRLILQHPQAHLLTLGYSTNHPNPAVRFGIDLDQSVRRAMAHHLPCTAYYSEAFFATRLVGSIQNYSFMSASRGNGRTLESLAWLDNGIARGLIHRDACVYGGPGGVVTPIDRLLQRSAITKVAWRINQAFVKALRSIGQSALDPREWGDRINFSAPTRYYLPSKKGSLSTIFKTFDPIHLFKNFSSNDFQFWRLHYGTYVNHMLAAFRDCNLQILSVTPPVLNNPMQQMKQDRTPNNHSLNYALNVHSIAFALATQLAQGAIPFFNSELIALRVAHRDLCFNYHDQEMGQWMDRVIQASVTCGRVIFQGLNAVAG